MRDKMIKYDGNICFVIKLLVTTLVRQGIYMTQWGQVTHAPMNLLIIGLGNGM